MDDQARDTVMSAPGDVDPANGGHLPGDDRVGQQAAESADYARGGSAAGDGVDAVSGSKSDSGYRGEKQVKVLIGSHHSCTAFALARRKLALYLVLSPRIIQHCACGLPCYWSLHRVAVGLLDSPFMKQFHWLRRY